MLAGSTAPWTEGSLALDERPLIGNSRRDARGTCKGGRAPTIEEVDAEVLEAVVPEGLGKVEAWGKSKACDEETGDVEELACGKVRGVVMPPSAH